MKPLHASGRPFGPFYSRLVVREAWTANELEPFAGSRNAGSSAAGIERLNSWVAGGEMRGSSLLCGLLQDPLPTSVLYKTTPLRVGPATLIVYNDPLSDVVRPTVNSNYG